MHIGILGYNCYYKLSLWLPMQRCIPQLTNNYCVSLLSVVDYAIITEARFADNSRPEYGNGATQSASKRLVCLDFSTFL